MKNKQVNIENQEHLKKALAFAKTLPKESRQSLRRSFHTINNIKKNYVQRASKEGGIVTLVVGPDWVKHSFCFMFAVSFPSQGTVIRGMNGGIILHGFEETFSVELSGKNYPHWSIHT
jgi:hypothetical protein